MFEPKTFPTESGAPPDNAAVNATVNSGSEVEKAMILKPTAVFPSRVIAATFTAFFIARLLAQFRTRKETAIIKTFAVSSVNEESAFFLLLYCPFLGKFLINSHGFLDINISIWRL